MAVRGKTLHGQYQVRNPQKYKGVGMPTYRSGWESQFMQFCDNNSSILSWASESVKIPYRNPLTGKQTVYIPDFLISYVDKNGTVHGELIEIKPAKETFKESVRSQMDAERYAVNQEKWKAASAWSKRMGVKFRILTEHDLFAGTKPKNRRRK